MSIKRIICAICTAALLLSMVSFAAVPASAQSAGVPVGGEGGEEDEPVYVPTDDDGLYLVEDEYELEQLNDIGWFVSEDGTMIVGGSDWYDSWMEAKEEYIYDVETIYFGYSYKTDDSDGYSSCTVNYVPQEAFKGCGALTRVVFPRENFWYIGDEAFDNCGQLHEVCFYTPVAVGHRAFSVGMKSATFTEMPTTYKTDYSYAGEQTDEPAQGILADGTEGTKGYLYPVNDGDEPPFKTCPFADDAFEGTPGDFVIHVPSDDYEQLKVIYPDYADQFVAEDPSDHYGLSVNGVAVTENTTVVQCGSGTATFDPATSTLTLENATLTEFRPLTSADPGNKRNLSIKDSVIYSSLPDLTIELKGKNAFGTYVADGEIDRYYTEDAYSYGDTYCVRTAGSVTFSGDGTLDTYLMTKDGGSYSVSDKRCYTQIAADGDVAFDGVTMSMVNVDASLDKEENSAEGVVTLTDSTLTRVDITAPSGFKMKDSTVSVDDFSYSQYGGANQTSWIDIYKGEVTLENSELIATRVKNEGERADIDLYADGITLKRSDLELDGTVNIKNLYADVCTEQDIEAAGEYRTENRINYITGTFVTISDSTAKNTTISAYSEFTNGDDTDIYGQQIIDGDTGDADASDSGKKATTLTLSNTTLEDSWLPCGGSAVMNKVRFAGTKMEISGDLTMTECTSYAEHIDQNSPITVEGDRIDLISCDFEGIANTNQGERKVYLGNGVPIVETFEYKTLSGVSLSFYSEQNNEPVLNFKDSRLMLQKIFTSNNTKINIDETRMMLIDSVIGYGDPGYDYDSNITITGNIAIVTGAWGMNSETGIFIDYLGDYFTFDEDTGLLCIYNAYGARGWRQRTEYWDDNTGKDVKRTEITNKVKKIIVGDDVDWDIGVSFADYKNVKEIEIGDGVHDMFADQLEGCVSLEKITFGTGYEYITDDTFKDCPKLKTLVLEGEMNASDYTKRSTFDNNDVNLNIIVPKELEAKYKTEIFPSVKNCINRSEKPIYYPLTVNGEIFASDHLTIKCGSGTATFDPATNTLTLDNATITKHAKVSPSDQRKIDNDGVIESRIDDLTIVLKGNNEMKWSDPNAGLNGNGIDAWGALTITGGGNLAIQCEEKYYTEDYHETKTPMLYSTGNMTINGATIKVTYSENWEEDPYFGKSYADELYVLSNKHYNDYTHGSVTNVAKPITIINSTLEDVYLDAVNDGRLHISDSTINGTYYKKDDSVKIPDNKPDTPNDRGDIDGDGETTANDALIVLRTSVGMSELSAEQFKIADVDGDTVITANDALSILRFSVSLDA